MPIYEYQCPRCGQVFERLMRLGAVETPPCPQCGAEQTRRRLSVIARSGGECGASGTT